MAMIDNVDFLISHIRNSFITSDDTGMCELIIDNEEIDRSERRPQTSMANCHYQLHKLSQLGNSDSGLESSDSELSNTLDILPDMDYGHRRRSNTAQRLDRMKKEKRNQVKVKTVVWKNNPSSYNMEEKGHLFEKKMINVKPEVTATKVDKKSLLTQQLETLNVRVDNSYREYAKFDGRSSIGMATKKIDIFLTMAPPDKRYFPMPVVVQSTARVQDLIGLICWQYAHEEREPSLSENVDQYCLHIAEDDGEVDEDFPSLDNREPVSKFGFAKLALVEREGVARGRKSAVIVTIHAPNRGFNKLQVANTNVTMREIMEKVLRKRRIKVRPGLNYRLEKQQEAGVNIDLESSLASQDTLEFCLVRENSAREDVADIGRQGSVSDVAETLTSHQYKSYLVSMIHKLRTNSDVQLGISGEKVEIDPVVSKGAAKLFRQRAVTYEADAIADCSMMEQKSNGRSVFRMTYHTGHDYKHHSFEAEQDVALEIVLKVNNILDMRFSPARKDFVESYEKKLTRKRDSIKYS